ncbi:hypothetical protein [Natrinema amylolyticum]|uniref:hypothetical protein n=1 Tax=Natrinema amylolyticum TaxID=2878679 RepID=UPI00299E0F2F|nr:hypothetical protein [Natrinema amylolyticum]
MELSSKVSLAVLRQPILPPFDLLDEPVFVQFNQPTVHFLHVIDMGTELSAGASGSIAPELTETLEEEAKSALDDAANRPRRQGSATTETLVRAIHTR